MEETELFYMIKLDISTRRNKTLFIGRRKDAFLKGEENSSGRKMKVLVEEEIKVY